MNQYLSFIILAIVFFTCISVINYIQNKKMLKPETSRKLGHIMFGSILISLPFLFENIVFSIVFCLLCALFLFLAPKLKKYDTLVKTERVSYGEILFPTGVLITLIISKYVNEINFFVASIVVLTISDVLAVFVGQLSLKTKKIIPFNKINNSIYRKFGKTFYGSFAFLISSYLILLLTLKCGMISCFLQLLLVAIVVTVTEFLSRKGFDNLLIPVSTIVCLSILHWW